MKRPNVQHNAATAAENRAAEEAAYRKLHGKRLPDADPPRSCGYVVTKHGGGYLVGNTPMSGDELTAKAAAERAKGAATQPGVRKVTMTASGLRIGQAVPLGSRWAAGGGLFAVVDLVDFEFAMQWRWKAVKSKGRKVKWYAFRTTRFAGRHVAYWLHKEICLRAHGLPPTKEHLIGDHRDGNSLNNRRDNLQWATHSQNCANRGGIAYQQLRLAIGTGDISRVQRGRRRADL